jgi:hypothetical protein
MSDTESNDTESNDTDQEDTGSGNSNPDVTTTEQDDGLSDEEREQLEKDRQERLDPDNRPVNALVDNTGREFDIEKEDFKYAAGEEPDADEETTPIIGADRPEGVEGDTNED